MDVEHLGTDLKKAKQTAAPNAFGQFESLLLDVVGRIGAGSDLVDRKNGLDLLAGRRVGDFFGVSRQGRRLADNIVAGVRGEPSQPFRFKALGLLAGLGRRSAVAEIFGLRFSGFIACWLWRTIYLMKLPGLERKLRVAIDWSLDLFFPRDIVYLRPLPAARGQHVVSRPAADDFETSNGALGADQVCEIPSNRPTQSERVLQGVH